jgi:hypothetical protein
MPPAGPSTHGGHRHSAAYDVVFFIALLSTAVALGGALAHLFELPNKVGLPRDEYFVVQQVYRGWDRLGYVLLVELVSMTAVAIMSRRERPVFWPALFAILFLLAAQAVFWTNTFPANVATRNWTVIPDDWEALRVQWEYSHAVGATCQLLAMSSLIIAVLARARLSERRSTGR